MYIAYHHNASGDIKHFQGICEYLEWRRCLFNAAELKALFAWDGNGLQKNMKCIKVSFAKNRAQSHNDQLKVYNKEYTIN